MQEAVKPKDIWTKLEAYAPHKKTVWNMPDNKFCHKLREFFRRKEWSWFITVRACIIAHLDRHSRLWSLAIGAALF